MKLLPLILLLLPLAASADTKPGTTRLNNRCTTYHMCTSQAATGECVDASGDVIVHKVGRRADFTFYSTRSTAADYECNIWTNTLGFDAQVSIDQVNTVSITDEVPVYTMAVLLNRFWVTCTLCTDVFDDCSGGCPGVQDQCSGAGPPCADTLCDDDGATAVGLVNIDVDICARD
jgi:hypothetical protein